MKELDRLVEWFKKRVSVHKHEEHHLKFIMTEYAKIYHAEQLRTGSVIKPKVTYCSKCKELMKRSVAQWVCINQLCIGEVKHDH
ncbi:hypothetical protein ACJRPK_13715 [Aquimarina sp. 2-A2]|uniref:hypothetical protein n=1 Tax=Aquimarina sp. 2-A2 TaxID=3382644 RepID=UPI00387EF3AC